MKNIYLVLFSVVVLASCKKSETPGTDGCISQIKKPDYHITPADSVTAITLLQQNHITYSNVDLEYISSYTITEGETPGLYQTVFVIQRINDLDILSGSIWYQFKNGALQTVSGTKYGSVNLSSYPSLGLPQLRRMYLAELGKNTTAEIAATFKDSCLVAQFGYYDLNVNINNTPNFVKAWSITPKHSPYPQVILRDDDGKTIIYNRGIVVF